MLKVNYIYHIITEYFKQKATFQKVNILIDIIYKKKDIYIITNTITSKSLVYQEILIVIKGLVLVILLIITFIED